MTTSGALRVVAAFVIGVVAAMGTALLYVNSENAKYVQPTVEAASPIQQPPLIKRDIQLPQDLQPAAQTALTDAVPAAQQTVQAPSVQQTAVQEPSARQPSVQEPSAQQRSYPAVHEAKTQVQNEFEANQAVTSPVRKSSPALPPVQIAQNSPHGYPAISTPQAQVQVPAATMPVVSTPPVSVPDPPSTPSVQNSSAYPTYSAAPGITRTPAPASRFQPHTVELDPGTNVAIRLGETISSEHNFAGDTFRATLLQPIIRNGFIIADKGSKVLGRIINVQRPGRVQGVGDLALTLTEINTTDGQRVHINTDTFDRRGSNSHLSDAAKIASGAGLGAIIGALGGGGKGAAIGAGVGGAAGTAVAMVTRGHDAEVANETAIVFRLTNPVVITERMRF